MFMVPFEIYSKARCLPVLAGQKKTDEVLGGAYGTISVVSHQGVVALVTAQHVLEYCANEIFQGRGAKQIYSPLRPNWGLKTLNKYDWRKISHPLDQHGESRLDIAYAILNESQLNEIAPRHIHLLSGTSNINSEFGAVLHGYSGNYNNTAGVRRREAAKPMSCGVEIKISPLAPFKTPTFDNYLYFKYTGNENDVWNNEKHYSHVEKRPALDGLSGGPIFYCRNLETGVSDSPSLSVVGFLLEHDIKSGIAKALVSDILIERLTMPHMPREVALKQI